jgi:6-phosphogluconolactonase
MRRFQGRSTLRLVQSISTIPNAFPTTMNTCGRMCVHKSGQFVIVSNRGHQSITVFRVKTKGSKRGELQNIGCIHTRGETPRHFQFDNSGQYLLVANQDTDSIAIFNFNLCNGELKYSGNEYRVPSPNFVCCCPTHSEDDIDIDISHTNQFTSISAAFSLQGYDDTSPSCSDSDDSTVPTWTGRSSEDNIKAELAKAREEIESLKKLLAERA